MSVPFTQPQGLEEPPTLVQLLAADNLHTRDLFSAHIPFLISYMIGLVVNLPEIRETMRHSDLKGERRDLPPVRRMDGPEKMNTISGDFRQEIEDIWREQIEEDAAVRAVVFISAKPDNFIAGADIRMISSTKDKADLEKVGRLVDVCALAATRVSSPPEKLVDTPRLPSRRPVILFLLTGTLNPGHARLLLPVFALSIGCQPEALQEAMPLPHVACGVEVGLCLMTGGD